MKLSTKTLLSTLLCLFVFIPSSMAQIRPGTEVISVNKLQVEASTLEQGERVSLHFTLQLPSQNLVAGEWITLVFPDVYSIPAFVASDIQFSGKVASKVEIKDNYNVRIQLPIDNEGLVDFVILPSAELRNPIASKSFVSTLWIEKWEEFFESNEIQLIYPENSVTIAVENDVKPNQYGWLSSHPEIVFHSTQADSIYYSIDNNEYIQFDNKPVIIPEGIHSVLAYAVRNTGLKEKVASWEWKIDPFPPACLQTNPSNKTWVNSKEIDILFSIESISPSFIDIHDEVYTVKNGVVKIQVPLKPGKNAIQYTLMNQAGHESKEQITLYCDVTAPVVTLYSPGDNQVICGLDTVVIGKTEPGCRVEVNTKKTEVDTYGNFSLEISSVEGKNTVLVTCTDKAGNSTTVQQNYYYYSGVVLELHLQQQIAYVNHEEVNVQPFPFRDSQNGEVYIPLRFIADSLSYKLSWDSNLNAAILQKNGTRIYIHPNDSVIKIEHEEEVVECDIYYSPTVVENTIMVPIEFTKKILGAEVTYQQENDTIFVAFCEERR